MTTLRSAVFLDRDGTINEEGGYIERRDRLVLYPWAIDAVRLLNRAGFLVALTTNQAGIAHGYFSEAVVQDLHTYLAEQLASGGARLDAYYYCPHHPEGKVAEYATMCRCRKPGPGMVEQAVHELGIDPLRSFVVGDKWLDVGMAQAVGARGILVRTGYGATEERRQRADVGADFIADNLMDAVGWILRTSTSGA